MEEELVSSLTSVNSDEVGEDTNKKYSPFYRSELFETYCPILMSLGMSYEEYWYGDNEAPKWYLKAHKMKQEYEDEQLWLQGMYIYDALCKVAPLYSFKPSEPLPYPSLPYGASDMKKQKVKEHKEHAQHLKNIDNFKKNMKLINNSMKKEGNDG